MMLLLRSLVLALDVHFLAALTVGSAKVAPSQPLPVSTHFMELTYGHLRSGSNRVGTALSNLLEVQSSLEEMQEDIAGEYDRWQQKKQALGSERSNHEKEIARLQAVLKEQVSAREEVKRLQGEVSMQTQWSANMVASHTEARRRWQVENVTSNQTLASLALKIDLTDATKVGRMTEITNVTHQCQELNRGMQQQILTLNGQVQQLEDVRSKINAASQLTHSKLLEHIKIIQDGMHSLQVKMIDQAKLRMDQRRLSGRANLLVKQREAVMSFTSACDVKMEEIDRQIAGIKKSMSDFRAKAQLCQVTDAENQGVQAELNRCRSANGLR